MVWQHLLPIKRQRQSSEMHFGLLSYPFISMDVYERKLLMLPLLKASFVRFTYGDMGFELDSLAPCGHDLRKTGDLSRQLPPVQCKAD